MQEMHADYDSGKGNQSITDLLMREDGGCSQGHSGVGHGHAVVQLLADSL